MVGLSLLALASDIALCFRTLCDAPAVLLGHAFGKVLARVSSRQIPDLVKAVVLAAADAFRIPEDVGKVPFLAGDPSAPEPETLAALRKAFRTQPRCTQLV